MGKLSSVVARIRGHLREVIASVCQPKKLVGLVREHEELLEVFRKDDWSNAVALDKHIM